MKLRIALRMLFFSIFAVLCLYIQFMNPEHEKAWRIVGISMGVLAGWNANRLIKEIFGTHL